MISKLWWVNFLLALFTLLLISGTVMIWQQAVVVPPPSAPASKDRWPDPATQGHALSASEDYNIIALDNLFHEKRIEHTPESAAPPELPDPAAIPVAEPEPDPVPEEVEVLERKDLNVFGVMILDSLKYAFVNDLDGEDGKKQVRVTEKDEVGPYIIEKILPEHVIVAFQDTHYRVPVFEKKDGNKPPAASEEKSAGRPEKPATAKKTPSVVIASDKDETQQPGDKKVTDSDDQDEWIILDTPFGKKRIKKQK